MIPPSLTSLPFLAHVWDVESTPLAMEQIPVETSYGRSILVLIGSLTKFHWAVQQVLWVASGCFVFRHVTIHVPSKGKEYRVGENSLIFMLPKDILPVREKMVCFPESFHVIDPRLVHSYPITSTWVWAVPRMP